METGTHLDISVHSDHKRLRKINRKLDGLHELLNRMLAEQIRQGLEERLMSEKLDRLVREVAETRTVVESAKVLIGSLADQIRENLGDEAALEALADDLDRQQTELAGAVEAGTVGVEPVPGPGVSVEPVEPVGSGETPTP